MATFAEGLTAEQKPLFDAELKKAADDAVAKHKAEAEDARKKAIPDKYEVKFSENSPLDVNTDTEKIAATARKLGLSQEQAAEFVKHHDEVAAGIVARQQHAIAQQADKWKAETTADKDLGGTNMATTLANVKRVMDRFAPGDDHPFRKFMNETGYGNHPAYVRMFNELGKAMAEEKFKGGPGDPGSKKLEDWEIVYGPQK